MDRQRIDKWLWHARVVRTRSAAAALVTDGRIRLNGARIDAPSQLVRAGDMVTVAIGPVRVLKVCGFAERRGSAAEAAPLFEIVQTETRAVPSERNPAPSSIGRPDKRERRDILHLTRPGKG